MAPKTVIQNEAGFTLLEVIVAIAILGLAVTGLAGALATGLRISNVVEEQTTSATLATRYMEETLAQGIELFEPEDCEASIPPQEGYSVECVESHDSGEITVTVYSGNDVLFEITTRKAGDP